MQAEYDPATLATRGQVHAASLAGTDASGFRQCDVSEAGTAESRRQHLGFLSNVRSVRQVIQRTATAGADMRSGGCHGPAPTPSRKGRGRMNDAPLPLRERGWAQPNADSPVCAR